MKAMKKCTTATKLITVNSSMNSQKIHFLSSSMLPLIPRFKPRLFHILVINVARLCQFDLLKSKLFRYLCIWLFPEPRDRGHIKIFREIMQIPLQRCLFYSRMCNVCVIDTLLIDRRGLTITYKWDCRSASSPRIYGHTLLCSVQCRAR